MDLCAELARTAWHALVLRTALAASAKAQCAPRALTASKTERRQASTAAGPRALSGAAMVVHAVLTATA